MKIIFCFLYTSISSVIWAQNDVVLKNTYFNFYPIELLAGQPRVGLEYEMKPNLSFVFDGQYFFGEDPYYNFDKYYGIAIKADLRFYTPKTKSRNRTFYGPNLLIKRKNNAYLGNGNLYNSNVIALNFKYGKEFYLSYYAKLDLFCGIGLRYKSAMSNTIFLEDDSKILYDNILPNILLGLTFKFR